MTRFPEKIHTPRLTLERRRVVHFDEVWASVETSQDELGRWLAWAVEPNRTESRRFYEQTELDWDRGLGWGFTIFHEGHAIGDIGLGGHKPLVGACEIGYWLRSDHAGRGLMTEACSGVVDYGFNQIDLHRIELHAALDNIGSVRVAEKIGFTNEGLLRDGSRGREGFHDVYVFGLLASDDRRKWH